MNVSGFNLKFIETKEAKVLCGPTKNCQDPDLNWRHEDFQSTALPTELPSLYSFINGHEKSEYTLMY